MGKIKDNTLAMGDPLTIELYRELQKQGGERITPLEQFGLYKEQGWGNGVKTYVKVKNPSLIHMEFPINITQRILRKKIKEICNYYHSLEAGYEIFGKKIIPKTYKDVNSDVYNREHRANLKKYVKDVYSRFIGNGYNKTGAYSATAKAIKKIPCAIWGGAKFKKRSPYPTTPDAIRKIVSS